MTTSEAKALAQRLRRHRWRATPADVLESSLDAALAERRRVDDGPQTFQARVDRLWHAFWRFKWAFALLLVGSSLAAGVSHHNRVAASRLEAVRQELIKRAGSDKLIDLVPPTVPPEENFWAIPAIQACRLEPKTDEFAKYAMEKLKWHEPGLVLPEFPQDGSAPDLDAWLKSAIAAGYQPPPGATVLEALRDHLNRHSGPMDELMAGLQRPKSQVIPDARKRLQAVGGDMLRLNITEIANCNRTARDVTAYARCAALCGDFHHAAGAMCVVLRIAEGTDSGLGFVGALVTIAATSITADALPDCLSSPGWTAGELELLQREVARVDTLELARRGLLQETIGGVERILRAPEWVPVDRRMFSSPLEAAWFDAVTVLSPRGFVEDNAALYAELMLGLTGPEKPEWWLGADAARHAMHEAFSAGANLNILERYWNNYSPTRIIASVTTPMISNLPLDAAKASFKRRAATLTCALLCYRLAHGVDPATLDALVPEFLPAKIEDPAKPGEWLKFRPGSDGGLLIWSIGPDRKDDGGMQEKTAGEGGDWLWRIAAPSGNAQR